MGGALWAPHTRAACAPLHRTSPARDTSVRSDLSRISLHLSYTCVYSNRNVHMYCQNKVSILLLLVLITSLLCRVFYKSLLLFLFHGTEFRVSFSSVEWFGAEFREFASIFVPRYRVPSFFLLCGMIRNGIPRVFCSAEQPESRRNKPIVLSSAE
jgi:hypothetical protein